MKVGITGATGFVGGGMVQVLSKRGYKVRANGRNPVGCQRLREDGVEVISGDLEQRSVRAEFCQELDVVVHCAGLSSPWGCPAHFQRQNVELTRGLLETAQHQGVGHFIFLSSSGVYFANNEGTLVVEEHPLPPICLQHPYVASKREAERLVRESPVPWTILRPRAIYGPGDTSLLPRLLDRLKRRRLPIIGSGRTISSMTHLENLAVGLELVLRAGPQGLLNLCDGEPVNLWEVIARVARQRDLAEPRLKLPYPLVFTLVGLLEGVHRLLPVLGEPSLTRYTVGLLGKSQSLSWEKAQRLGYQPLFDTFVGVERTLSGMGQRTL